MQFRSAKHATNGGTSRRFFDRFHTPRTSSKRRRAPVLEMLEGRTLLSITATLSGSVLTFDQATTSDHLTLYETHITTGADAFAAVGSNGITGSPSPWLFSNVTRIVVNLSDQPSTTLTVGSSALETAPWDFAAEPIQYTGAGSTSTLETQLVNTAWSLALDSGTSVIKGTVNSPTSGPAPISFSGVGILTADSTTTNTLTGESGSAISSWALSGSPNAGIYTDAHNNSVTFSGFDTLTADPTTTDNNTLIGVSGATSSWALGATSDHDGTYTGGGSTVNFHNFENLTGSTGVGATNTLTGETGATSTTSWTLSDSANDGHYYDGTNTVTFTHFQNLTGSTGGGATNTLTGVFGDASNWTLDTTATSGSYVDTAGGSSTVNFTGFNTLAADPYAANTLTGANHSTTWTLGDSANDGNYLDISNSSTVNFTGFGTLTAGSGTNILNGENNASSTWTLGSTYSYQDVSTTVNFSGFNALKGGNGGSNDFEVNTTFGGSLTGGSDGDSDTFNLNPGGSVTGGITGESGNSTIVYFTEVDVKLTGYTTSIGYNGQETQNVSGHFTGINAVWADVGGTLTGDSSASNSDTSTWDLGASTYQETSPADGPLTFQYFGTLYGDSGTDTFKINASTPPNLDLVGGSHIDNFVFSAGDTLNGTINGGTTGGTSTLDYSAYTTAVNVNLGTGTAPGTYAISNIGGLDGSTVTDVSTTLVGPNAATTWDINGANSGTLVNTSTSTTFFTFSSVQTLSGGVLANTFALSSTGSVSGAITGGSTNDTLDLSGLSAAATVDIGVNHAGSTTGNNSGNVTINSIPVNFSGIANVKGTTGTDSFVLFNGMGLTGKLNGGNVNDTLDYSHYSTSVRVNLTTLSATNIDGGLAGGIGALVGSTMTSTGIETVIGGSGNDILIGDAATDHLTDGNGNDVIVGGGGAVTITVGTGNDIIITGSRTANATVHRYNSAKDLLEFGYYTQELNLAALNSLMAEWDRTGESLTTKMGHLAGTSRGGLNGSYVLNSSTFTSDSGTVTTTA